jgi:hypothetical protein
LNDDIPFLKIEDAKTMQKSIESLNDKLSSIDEKLNRIVHLFNPQIDGERGILVRLYAIEKEIETFRKFIYGGLGVYGFILFAMAVYNIMK